MIATVLNKACAMTPIDNQAEGMPFGGNDNFGFGNPQDQTCSNWNDHVTFTRFGMSAQDYYDYNPLYNYQNQKSRNEILNILKSRGRKHWNKLFH